MDSFPPLTPPVDQARSPPFFEMNTHPKRFERMSAQLMDAEPSVKQADLYGVGRQRQHGIDVLADRAADDGIEVGSCKCYQNLGKGDLAKWSDEFLAHWETWWKDREVCRFVLITAATNATSTVRRPEFEAERERFRELGIEYELWGPAQLEKRLQQNRVLAVRWLGDVWADVLCGRAPPAATEGRVPTGALSAFQVGQLQALQSILSGQALGRLERATADLRRGDFQAVEALIVELKGDPVWGQLDAEAQSRLLRLEASVALQRRDVDEAERLAELADKTFPAEPRLRAHIALHKLGVQKALDVLGTPSTRAGRQLRASLLLQGGDLNDVELALNELVGENDSDPETLRLLALLRLAQNRRPEALAAISKAAVAAPDWLGVMRTQAIVRYALALSPSVLANWIFYPNPVDVELVRRDDQSQERLADALAGFEALISKGDSPAEDEVWKLACLSNLSDRRDEAEAFCQALLERNPVNVEAIGWSVARGYRFDRAVSLSALAEACGAGRADAAQVRAYAWLSLDTQVEPGDLCNRLKSYVPALTGEGLEEAKQWIDRLSGAAPSRGDDDDDDAVVFPPDLPDRITQAAQSGDWSAIEALLAETLATDPPDVRALSLAGTLAAHGCWSALGPNVDALLRFDTASAIALCAYTLHHTAAPAQVIKLLGEQRSNFPGGELPHELRRMEIVAQAGLGDISTALASAERLAVETGSVDDRLHLAKLHLQVGDIAGAVPLVRDTLRDGNLAGQIALGYSIAFTRADPTLARELLRHAMRAGLEGGLVANALSQAFKLGLDNETAGLMAQMQARAAAGADDARNLTLDEVIETVRAGRERDAELGDHLAAGAVPFHILPDSLARMAPVYRLDGPKPDSGPLPVFFIRHGARGLDLTTDIAWSQWALHVDVTGLLLAEQLDLLDHMEALTTPLGISRHVPETLHQMEQAVTHVQPSRVDSGREILRARATGGLRLTSTARESETVRHARGLQESHGPGPTVHSVADALRDLGDIDEPTYQSALACLGPRSQGQSVPPSETAELLFIDNTLESIASAGLLGAVVRRFSPSMTADAFDRVAAEVMTAEAGEALADRLAALRTRIAEGLERGRYRFVAEANKPADRRQGETSSLERCLFDLLTIPAEANGVLWADDRFVTSYWNANGNRLVGVVEVLNALQRQGRISSEERRLKLLKLRRGGALFIPVGVDEVMTPLLAAPIRDGRVVETPELATIRRYLSAALWLDPKLKIGPTTYDTLKDRPDEILFLLTMRRLATNCLVDVWADTTSPISRCRARSDWLWESLRMEQCVRELTDREVFAALLLAGMLTVVGDHSPTKTISLRRRRPYYTWLNDRVLLPRTMSPNDAFFTRVAALVRDMLTATLEALPKDATRLAQARELFRIQVTLMPEPIRQLLVDDRSFTAAIAMPTRRVVTVAGLEFGFERFWDAIETALRYGKARVRPLKGRSIRLRRGADGTVIFGGKRKANFVRDINSILAVRGAARAEKAERFLRSLDLEDAPLEEAQRSVARARSPGGLAAALETARESSVVILYEALAAELRQGRQVPFASFLPPPAHRYAYHLRIAGVPGPIADRVDRAWRDLAARIGPKHALRRLVGVPVPLAPTVATGLAAEDVENLEAFLGPARTPMAILHRARLCQELSRPDAEVDGLVRRFVETSRDYGGLFSALLTWTEQAFERDVDWLSMPTGDRLAMVWAHADRVLDILIGHGAAGAESAAIFRENPVERSLGDLLRRGGDYALDAANPELIGADVLIYHGLAHIFGDADVSERFPTDLAPQIAALLTSLDGDQVRPSVRLVTRSGIVQNSLGSFLLAVPVEFLEQALDPSGARASAVSAGLAALGKDPNDADAWIRLSVLGRPALEEAQALELAAAFKACSLPEICKRAKALAAARVVVDAFVRLGGGADEDLVLAKLAELAREQTQRDPVAPEFDGEAQAEDALHELLELAAAAARANEAKMTLERFEKAVRVLANAWPESVPTLRHSMDLLVRREPPADTAALWEAFVSLRAWP